jgi:GAF domain-containing protein
VCRDLDSALLSQRPERFYTWIADADISVAELLLVPLHMGGEEPLGTLWVVADNEGHFNSGHSRVLTELAKFAGIAMARAGSGCLNRFPRTISGVSAGFLCLRGFPRRA